MSTCPICLNELNKGEFLIAQFYPPRYWWVVQHMIPTPEGKSDEPAHVHPEGSDEGLAISIPGYKGYCGQAGFQFKS